MVSPLRIALLLIAILLGAPIGARTAAASGGSAFVPVLIYHHVKLLKPADDAIERGLTVLPKQFTAQLHFIMTHGYHALTAAQMVGDLRSGHSVPRRSVVISFDDGYADIYPNVYRVLHRYHLRATFFVVPNFLNTPRYLTWSQVIDMARHGMDIEAHTLTHPDLTTLTPSRRWQEIFGSRHVLEARLKRPVRLLAYPYGAFNAAVLRAVRRAGFFAAFTTDEGWRQSRERLLECPRIYVDGDDSLKIFAGRLVADPAVLAADPT